MPAPETCADCRFWDRYTDAGLLDSQRRVGDCRRRPPLIIETVLSRSMIVPSFGMQVELDEAIEPLTIYAASAFPVTHEKSWCGEFNHLRGEPPIC
ncbi:hypothetical protein [Sphingomonas endolithica]|uniref:hypothetical protein n=1 Tax=Sphingomonas endolithica TaxID=2972485 RepID=UPI0021AF111B|nr:hypothetical protein [Sphingomonas sp. ZFBP2030]